MVGKELPRDKETLNETLAYVKGEVESLVGNELSIELKDGNRPDLWSIEGIARELRGSLGIELGLRRYEVKSSSGIEVLVDPRLEKIRPYIGCSVVKSVHIDGEVIRELMHLQDKLDQTYGRRRRKTSIGFYRRELIQPPLHYKASTPKEYCFVPLEGTEPMTLEEILERHPKGIEYGPIVRGFPLWPMLVDDQDQVLSFPPIINSNTLGKIAEGEQDILVEVTGTNLRTVLNTLTIVTLSLADRGHEILSADVHYTYGPVTDDTTPKLDTKQTTLDPMTVQRLLGLKLDPFEMVQFLRRARYDAEVRESMIEVTIPCYRMDIMNSVDIVEDVAIAYGFNNIPPAWPEIATIGGLSEPEEYSNLVRQVMVGLGFQEVLTFSLTDGESQHVKMGLDPFPLVEISNPSSETLTSLRGWLIPSLMTFLANNAHATYPQKIFEVADCEVVEKASRDAKDVRKLAALVAHSSASFSEAKAIAEASLRSLGATPELMETDHPSFMRGRVGTFVVNGRSLGVIGEISPKVLDAWKIASPVSGFEIELYILFGEKPQTTIR